MTARACAIVESGQDLLKVEHEPAHGLLRPVCLSVSLPVSQLAHDDACAGLLRTLLGLCGCGWLGETQI